MPTVYPKCSPTEMLGLVVLLGNHKGNEEIARLADDLDLEIDEILPSVDYAQLLGLLKVSEGRAVLSDLGRKLLAGSINARKEIVREQLAKTALFKALLRALESAPERRLTEEEMLQLISFTTAPADEFVQNIINWGRYADLFRYDSDEHLLLPARRTGRAAGGGRKGPPAGPEEGSAKGSGVPPSPTPTPTGSEPPVANLAPPRSRRKPASVTLMAPPTSTAAKGT